ncbi:MAG: sigma-70 family RNA polymerase sigma factor [Planctomycetota bacterium]
MSVHSTEQLLLEHGGWLRQLARHLVGDPQEAEDLAQAAALNVLLRPPTRSDNVRGWLRSVTQNLWRNRVRDERRRIDREQRAGRVETTPDPVDVVVRGEQVRDLLDAVCALDEPFRRAIMLRYLDEVPPRRIAAQLGVPVATVNSLLHRGLTKLRRSLDRRYGGHRSAWSLVLMTFARGRGPARPRPATWGAWAATPTKVATTLALCALAVAWPAARLTSPTVEGRARDMPARVGATSIDAAAARAHRSTPVPNRVALASLPAVTRGTQLTPAMDSVSVHVIDADGRPWPFLAVEFRSAAAGAGHQFRSDADGRMTVAVPRVDGVFVAASADVATIYAGHHAPGSQLAPVVVVAPRSPLRGRVVDRSGAPVPDANVAAALPARFEARFQQSLEASQPQCWTTVSDARGEFALLGAPTLASLLLRVSASGYEPDLRPWPTGVDQRAIITLASFAAGPDVIEGRVVDPTGAGLAGASVAIGPQAATRSGPDGRFRLQTKRIRGDELVVAARGFLPARLVASDGGRGRGRWPEFVVVQLAGAPLTLRGHVLGADGRPMVGARVWLAKPELLGVVDGSLQRLENVLAGMPSAAEHRRRLLGSPAGFDALAYFNRAKDQFYSYVETDREGGFRLPGLQAKAYELVVMEAPTLLRQTFGPFWAGAHQLELVMPADRYVESIDGVVVSRDGTPIEAATVYCTTEVAHAELACDGVATLAETNIVEGPDGPRTVVRRTVTGPQQLTDHAGRFRFERVARSGVSLRVRGDDILDQTFALADQVDPAVPRLQVVRRARFRVAPSAQGLIDAFEMLDAGGTRLPVYEIRGRQASWHDRVLVRGASPVYSVSERAAEVVFYRGGVVAHRQAVALPCRRLAVLRCP